MNPLTQSKNTTILPVLISLVCFALLPQARAVCQEGCDLTNGDTFFGEDALPNDSQGQRNTATGAGALHGNWRGESNTANGFMALFKNTTGSDNTAIGSRALFYNTSIQNTAVGSGALFFNTIWGANTAVGYYALYYNDSPANTAIGSSALYNNRTGSNNTAVGKDALYYNTAGITNTAVGWAALEVNTGNNNLALGNQAGGQLTAGSDNIDLANLGVAGESATIRIGTSGTQTNTFIAGISGATVPTGVAVIVDADGRLGTTTSSARFKDAIQPMDKASEAILALKPVTFRYKKELDPKAIPQFGLVAEDVEKVNPDLVARDADGKAYTVRYEAVNAMLLNEFLKEHRKVQELEANDAEQQREIKALVATVKEQAAQIQKVSAQIELSKPAPRTVLNNQ
jgi:Chaperone of endosialidase